MIDIDKYYSELIELMRASFGSRLIYIGLQGSYLRGEATPNSDLDIMVVIDGLSPSDLVSYRAIVESLDHADKSCGFICSKNDLANWNPLEIANLINSTKDYFGVLGELVPVYSERDIRNFVKLSVNNLYHEICHRFIHGTADQNEASLPATYKGVFFILQNWYYLTQGQFVRTKTELLQMLDGRNREVLRRAMDLNEGLKFDFQDSFDLLFIWCQEIIASI